MTGCPKAKSYVVIIAAFGSITDAQKAAVAADTLAINDDTIVIGPPYKRLIRRIAIIEDAYDIPKPAFVEMS